MARVADEGAAAVSDRGVVSAQPENGVVPSELIDSLCAAIAGQRAWERDAAAMHA